MDYDICSNCIHADVCKYSLEVKSMIESIDDAITDRFDLEKPNTNIRVAINRCIVKYPLELKAECKLFKVKVAQPRTNCT